MPTCWIIAGPNSAGKTTFAMDYLPKATDCTIFINADLIAFGLSPLAADRCVCFMNDSDNPVLVFEQQGEIRDILHDAYFKLLSQEAGL